MYEQFLETCTEQEMIIFIVSLQSSRAQTSDDLDLGRYPRTDALVEWFKETGQNIADARAQVSRFTDWEYCHWHKKMCDWVRTLSDEEYIEYLRKMPWNE